MTEKSKELRNYLLDAAFAAKNIQEEPHKKKIIETNSLKIDAKTGEIILEESPVKLDTEVIYPHTEIDDILEKEEAELEKKITNEKKIATLIAEGKTRSEAEQLISNQ